MTARTAIACLLCAWGALMGAPTNSPTAAPATKPWDGKTQLHTPGGAYSLAVLEAMGAGPVRRVQVCMRDDRASRAYVVLAGEPLPKLALGSKWDIKREGSRLAGMIVVPITQRGGGKRETQVGEATLNLDAMIDKGQVSGTLTGKWDKQAVKANVSGMLRTEDEIRKADGLAAGQDWPAWNGPNADFSAAPINHKLADDLFKVPLVWASEHLVLGARGGGGAEQVGGYSGPIVGGGMIFLNQFEGSGDVKVDMDALAKIEGKKPRGQANPCISGDDIIWAFDAATGQLLWKQRMVDASVNGSGSKHVYINKTGAYHDGKVYMFGFTWRVYCLDARTGKMLWHSDLGAAHQHAEKLKAEALQKRIWARLEVEGAFIAIADGIPFTYDLAGGTVAFDPDTGKTLWRTQGRSPVRWRHSGRDYIVLATNSLAGDYAIVEPRTGKALLKFKAGASMQVHALAVSGDYLLTAEMGPDPKDARRNKPTGKLMGHKLDLQKVEHLWTSDEAPIPGSDGAVTFSPGRAHYGANPGREQRDPGKDSAYAVDLATGKVIGKSPFRLASGSTGFSVADRVMINNDMRHCDSTMKMWQVDSMKPLGTDALWAQWHENANGYDACMSFPCVDGRLFFRGASFLVCYDLRASPPGNR